MSKKKLPSFVFELGDTVWVMNRDKPIQGNITSREFKEGVTDRWLSQRKTYIWIRYEVDTTVLPHDRSVISGVHEKDIYRTKVDLINSL